MSNSQKHVDIVIRARDETQRAINAAKTAMDRFTAAQAKTAARRNQFAGLEEQARSLAKDYDAAAANAADLGRRLAMARRPSQQMKDDFAAARTEARRLHDQVMATLVEAGRMNGKVARPGGSFAAFETGIADRAQIERAAQAAVATDRLGDALARVAAYQQRKDRFAAFDAIASGSRTAENATEALTADVAAQTAVLNANTAAQGRNAAAKRSAAGGDLAGRITGAISTRNDRGPLGLRPYEMQNLGYQVNDFVTQVASGTNPTQAFAQQIGQVAQLFPGAIAGLLRFAPALGVVLAVLSPFVSKLREANAEAKTLSEFDKLLTRSGEGASYQAQKLAETARALDEYEGSLKDAREALTTFVNDSVDPAYLERFGRTALDVADVLGIKVADAAEKVSSAFTGNADAVLALDDELNFLTDSERKHIEKLRESKKDAEARTTAFAIFEKRYNDTAQKMKGPWSQILANFGGSWKAFVDYVNFADFSAIKAEITGLLNLIARLSANLPGARNNTVAYLREQKDANDRALAATTAALANNPSSTSSFTSSSRHTLERQQRRQIQRSFELGANIARQENAARERENNLRNPPKDTTLDPPAAANTSSGPKPDRSAEREAERLAERRKEFLQSLDEENALRQFQLSLIGQEERAQQIKTELRQKELEAAELGLELTAAQRAEIEKTVGDLYDAQRAREASRLIDQARLNLARARGEIESREAYIARELASAQMSALTEQGKAYATILGQIYDVEDATRRRVAAEKAVNDLVGLRDRLMEQIQFYEDAGQGGMAAALRLQLDGINAELVKAIDGVLVMLSTMSGPEAEAARLYWERLKATVSGVGEGIVVTGAQIDEMLASGAVQAANQFASAVGQGENAVRSLWDAFRQFAADFLAQIGQMILKQAVLNALKAAGGGEGNPGGQPGLTSQAAGFINSIFRHHGGLSHQGGGSRAVPIAAFANAARYHTGGIAGFKPNEVPAVLTRGEEVLTTRDPRHRGNGGLMGALESLKIINLVDPGDLLEKGLATERGEKALINHFSQNAGALKAVLS